MAYIGENSHFSFRSGLCEALPRASVSSAEVAALGHTLTRFFGRFCVGSEDFGRLSTLYALCSGISECGGEVCICESTDMPSFRFGCPLLSADCGVFVSGGSSLKIAFFDKRGFELPQTLLAEIMRAEPPVPAERSGRISSMTSFGSIYVNNLRDSFGGLREPIPAGISCGNRAVRTLWRQFFTGEDDELVLQISDNGQRVNAYSAKYGFISADKLTLAYCVKAASEGESVLLPDDFHYAAELSGRFPDGAILRFPAENGVPDEGGQSRFLRDPLYMCIDLLRDREAFFTLMSELPQISGARREIVFTDAESYSKPKRLQTSKGRVIITRSGRNMLSVLAQTLSAETSAELCAEWCEKLRKADKCRRTPESFL
ncbi:MAG: hypothetical protein Q4A05_08245 [Ruminococcus sp.]|nr:hypothetical protein [Ruminococcus sp.]